MILKIFSNNNTKPTKGNSECVYFNVREKSYTSFVPFMFCKTALKKIYKECDCSVLRFSVTEFKK